MPSFWDQLFGRAKQEPSGANQEPTPPPDSVQTPGKDLLRQSQTADWIAAIDFGTTYSKAALVRSVKGEISQDDARLLALDEQKAFVASALFIHDGKIYFGRRAFEISTDLNNDSRLRFESPKHLISEVNQGELERVALSAIDPTGRFTNGDLLALLLGFIVHRFHLALQDVAELAGELPKLRISRPAWSPDQELAGETLLRKYLGEGFILASTLGNYFDAPSGLPVERAQEGLSEVRDYNGNPEELFDGLLAKSDAPQDCIGRGFVPESTAVAAAHIDMVGACVFVVADIGGGTSDFGAFLSVPGNDRQGRIGEIRSVRQSLPKGGDEIDRLLLRYLKRKNGLEEELPVNQARIARLRRSIRTRKEDLFRQGDLVGEFEGDLTEFLDQDEVRALASELSSSFAVPFQRACEYESPQRSLLVIRTGGGSNIPFVSALGSNREAANVPSWIVDPDWQVLYPQLAVAIGAAMPVMPEQR
jgi:molecular chaperone DnaK (HSP70)